MDTLALGRSQLSDGADQDKMNQDTASHLSSLSVEWHSLCHFIKKRDVPAPGSGGAVHEVPGGGWPSSLQVARAGKHMAHMGVSSGHCALMKLTGSVMGPTLKVSSSPDHPQGSTSNIITGFIPTSLWGSNLSPGGCSNHIVQMRKLSHSLASISRSHSEKGSELGSEPGTGNLPQGS